MAIEKIEAVKKVGEALNTQQTSGVNPHDLDPAGKSQFQSYVDSSKAIQTSFQPLNKNLETSQVQLENVQKPEQNPVFAEENTSAQKNRGDSDQGQQKRRQKEEHEAVAGVTSTKSKSPVQSNSLIQELHKLNTQVTQAKRLNPEDLRNQAKGMIAQIEEVKTQLAQNQGEIKPSYQTVLRNRLTHIDDNLKIALSKAGIEYVAPTQAVNQPTNPIQKFIAILSTSQYQLENLDKTIGQLSLTNTQLTPANMLALQMKIGYVQQEIELFTSLLNKALESTKTIMNVQV